MFVDMLGYIMAVPAIAGPLLKALGVGATVGFGALELKRLLSETDESKAAKSNKKIKSLERLLADQESYHLSGLERETMQESDLIRALERISESAGDTAALVQESEQIRFQEMLARESEAISQIGVKATPSLAEVAAAVGINL